MSAGGLARPAGPRARGLTLAGASAFAALHALHYWPRVIDDAYINFRYARHLAAGDGFVFNAGGTPVEGFSSPLWLALSALALRLGAVDPLLVTKVAGLLALLGAVAATALLYRAADPTGARAGLLAAPLVAASPSLAYHAVTGLETALVALLLALAGAGWLGVLAGRRGPGPGALFGGALAALVVARPEGFGWTVALVASGLWLARGVPGARRRLLAGGAVAAAVLLALTLWRLDAFGAPVANTATAKVFADGALADHRRGLRYLAGFFVGGAPWTALALFAATTALLLRRGTPRDAALLVPPAGAAAFALLVNGDWMHSFRFLAPAVPFVAVAVARAAALFAGTAARAPRLLPAAAAVLALYVAEQVATEVVSVSARRTTRGWKRPAWALAVPGRVAGGFEAKLPGVTRWLVEHVAPGEVVAMGDVGFPAWVLREDVVDLWGLTDATLARVVPAGDAAGYAAYLRTRRPDLLLLRTEDGAPANRYDRLTVASGLLADYALAGGFDTYGRDGRGTAWARRAPRADPPPAVVLARYRDVIRWNPRVPALRAWRDAYQRGAGGRGAGGDGGGGAP